jgi:endonuclease/exonuclease/phosphatase family metal-dependent hydrolase
MRLLVWNIQWCRGTDGRVDPARIAAEVRRLADPDIACFQEVAEHYPELPGSAGENQVEALARALPGYELAYGYGVDLPGAAGRRKRFGNLVASRLPVRRILRHSPPWPADPEVPSMPRVAVEAVVETSFGAIRVVTTHLEYYPACQRAARIERLRELHAEACAHALRPPRRSYDTGPFVPQARPSAAILCGDFNMPPHDPARAPARSVRRRHATAGRRLAARASRRAHAAPRQRPNRRRTREFAGLCPSSAAFVLKALPALRPPRRGCAPGVSCGSARPSRD